MDTQQKYNEAEYFLEMVKDNDENRQRFEYNLSAFLSAARSVTFVLQKESSKNPEFDEWYCKKQMQMKRDKLFKFLKKKRDSGIHKKIIKPRAEISTTIPFSGAGSVSVETIVRNADGTINRLLNQNLLLSRMAEKKQSIDGSLMIGQSQMKMSLLCVRNILTN